MSLDTLANVKARIGVSSSADDTLLGLLQDSADGWVANYCGRDFGGGTFTEYYPGSSDFVLLRNYPVDTVTGVKVDPAHLFGDDALLPPERYVVHPDRGVVQSLCGPFLPRRVAGLVNSSVQVWTRGPRTVQVVYTTSAPVPADVKEAYARLIAAWYRRVKTDLASNFEDVRKQKFGDTYVIFDAESGLIPPDVRGLLDPYRIPNL